MRRHNIEECMSPSNDKPPRRPRAKAIARKPRGIVSRLSAHASWNDAYGTLLGVLALLIALRLVVVAACAMPAVANVGDRVALSKAWPGVNRAAMLPARMMPTAFAAPGEACRLDIAKMAQAGGVLTVMAVRPDGVVLSWAGSGTSDGADCRSRSGEVLLPRNDYVSLLTSISAKH
jgi:hypothetical protein